MTNKNQKAGSASPASKISVSKLPKMEMYAVLGLESLKFILEKLQSVEDSLEILAAQKARELNRSKPTRKK